LAISAKARANTLSLARPIAAGSPELRASIAAASLCERLAVEEMSELAGVSWASKFQTGVA
jgi:hypothetical protein